MKQDLQDPRIIEGMDTLIKSYPHKRDLYLSLISKLPYSLFIPTNEKLNSNSLSYYQTWDLDYIETFNEFGNEYIIEWEWLFKDFLSSPTYLKWSNLSNEYKVKWICWILEARMNGKTYAPTSYTFKKGTLKDWR